MKSPWFGPSLQEKKQIMADSKIVHTSANRGTTIDYTWNMKGNHIMKLAAIAATTNSNARQYDFFIDGQSFFNMPKVYELGLKGPITAHSRIPGVLSRDAGNNRGYDETGPSGRYQEQKNLERAIKASIEESQTYLSRNNTTQPVASTNVAPVQPTQQAPQPEVDLLNFSDSTAVVPATTQSSNQWNGVASPPHNQTYATTAYGTNPPGPSFAPPGIAPGQYNQPPPAQTYHAPIPATTTSPQSYPSNQPSAGYHVAPAYSDPFSPQPVVTPTYGDIQNQILQNYPVSVGQVNNNASQKPPVNSDPMSAIANETQKLTINSNVNETNDVPVQIAQNTNGVDKQLGKLVNLTDINSPVDASGTKLTMNPLNNKPKGANGFFGADTGSTGPIPTLGQMKALRSQSDATAATTPLSSSSLASGSMVTSVQQNGNFAYGNVPQMNNSNGNYGHSNTNQQPYGYGAQPNVQQQYGYGAPAGASYQQQPGNNMQAQQQYAYGMGANPNQ